MLRLLLLALLALASPLAAQRSRSPLVLISIDGLRPDYVLRVDSLGLRIPNLRRLVARGAHATAVRGVVPTLTYPSHTTLLTGVSPARHGILANSTFDPLQKNQGGWYWYAEDIHVPTLWDAARVAGIRTANVHWPVSVGAAIDLNLPQIWRTGTRDDRKLLRALATPGLVERLEREVGPYADGIDETVDGDSVRTRFVVRLLERERPGFTTAYLAGLDHVEHDAAPFSRAAFDALERIDRMVGELVAAADRASGGRATVAVVSDHGFARTDSSLNLAAAFRHAGLIDVGANGTPSAWRAIPWNALGSAAVMVADGADAPVRVRARAIADSLARDPANGIAAVLDAEALRERGGFPGALLLIAMRPPFIVGGSLDGPLVRAIDPGGAHGYLPDDPSMRSAFFIAGPGIAAGRSLGEIDMRDIAPTLAAVMRVRMATAEGKPLRLGAWERD